MHTKNVHWGNLIYVGRNWIVCILHIISGKTDISRSKLTLNHLIPSCIRAYFKTKPLINIDICICIQFTHVFFNSVGIHHSDVFFSIRMHLIVVQIERHCNRMIHRQHDNDNVKRYWVISEWIYTAVKIRLNELISLDARNSGKW